MKRKIYLVQPTYRDLQGRLLKAGHRLFTHSLAIPALSAAIPSTWEKEHCLEYFEDVNLETDAPVIAISCLGYDLFRGRELAEAFQKRGKVVLFGGCASELWRDAIEPVSSAIVCGNPGKAAVAGILADAERGELAPEYQCTIDLDYPFDYSPLSKKRISRRISLFPAIASAGCPHQCAFCCTAAKFKGHYYPRSLDAVMADLHVLQPIARHFVFVDSNLYGDRDHVVHLSERLIEAKLGLTWSAECTIDIGDDSEILRLLRRAGCRALLIGIETLVQRNMDRMQKPFLVEHYRDQIRRIQKEGIIVAGFFIFGFDGDTETSVDEFCKFVRDLDIAVPFFNLLCPVPGTRIYSQMHKEGRLLAERVDAYQCHNIIYGAPTHRCLFLPKQMTPREAELAFVEIRERLSSFPAILRRTAGLSPSMAAAVFLLNMACRRETRAVARAIRGSAQ
jgi:radical SAM superfamily enzyme YgiQ (UPF0313 family)